MLFLRRRRLGLTSCREIVARMETPAAFIRNDKLRLSHFDFEEYLVRWGCTSSLPDAVNSPHASFRPTILNKARAIHQVNNKLGFRMLLNEHELCPKTWEAVVCMPEDYFNVSRQVIMRPTHHAQGRNYYYANGWRSAHYYAAELASTGYYISEVIDKVAEYRVCVVQGRAAWVAVKEPREGYTPSPEEPWNVATGHFVFNNVNWDNWPLKVVRKAIEAFNLSELDFGGVDVMVDANNNVYVIEINSAPSITSDYRQQCMAKAFD